MRQTVLWVFRHLVVPVGLIWATGIFSVFTTVKANRKMAQPYVTFDSLALASLEMTPATIDAYGDSLYSLREQEIKTTGIYSPYDYFHDFRQYRMFEARYKDSLDGTLEGRCMILRCLSSFGGTLGKLVNLRDSNWRNGKNSQDFEEARAYWFPTEAAREREAAKHPIRWNDDVLKPVLSWLIRFYVRGLPFAFIMLLFWRIRLKEENQCLTFLPCSFILSWLAWPIVLGIDLRNRMYTLLRMTEIMSRRENMLSLLSSKETSLLKLGKSMSRKDFRLHLDGIGLVRRHSFRYALAFTVLFMVLLPGIRTYAAPHIVRTEKQMYVTQYVSADTGPPRACGIYSWRDTMLKDHETVFERMSVILFHLPLTIGRVLTGFLLEVRCVPKDTIIPRN